MYVQLQLQATELQSLQKYYKLQTNRDVGRRLKCCVLHARREVLGVSQITSIYLGFCVSVAYSIYHVACSS